jgi:hypothetical protein
MLNSALTVRSAEANSHSGKGWEEFTLAVVSVVSYFELDLCSVADIRYGGCSMDESATLQISFGAGFGRCGGTDAVRQRGTPLASSAGSELSLATVT